MSYTHPPAAAWRNALWGGESQTAHGSRDPQTHTLSHCHTHTHLQQLGVMLCGVGNLELLTEVGIHKQLDALKVASVALHDEELILHDTCTQQGFSSCKSG